MPAVGFAPCEQNRYTSRVEDDIAVLPDPPPLLSSHHTHTHTHDEIGLISLYDKYYNGAVSQSSFRVGLLPLRW